jgi:hypothetical protein
LTNTSATGGYLAPTGNPQPLADNALQDFIHDWLAGITGLPNQSVRPRWQPEPPNIPEVDTDWMAFGITRRAMLRGTPYEGHFPGNETFPNGYDELRAHDEFTVSCSVYGPNAERTTFRLSRGAYLAQNLESLQLMSMGLIAVNDQVTVPELIKLKWVNRIDVSIEIRRQMIFDYPVENLLSSEAVIHNESYSEPSIS